MTTETKTQVSTHTLQKIAVFVMIAAALAGGIGIAAGLISKGKDKGVKKNATTSVCDPVDIRCVNDPGDVDPYADIYSAYTAANPYDTILVYPATYDMDLVVRIQKDGLQFRGVNKNTVILDGSNNPNLGDQTHGNVFLVENSDDVVISDFKIVNAQKNGVRVSLSANVVVSNNIILSSDNCGITSNDAPNILVENNVIDQTDEDDGIYLANGGDNPIIRGNVVSHAGELELGVGDFGIQINADGSVISNAIVENNIIFNNYAGGINLASVKSSTIQNNIIFDNRIYAGAAGIHLTTHPPAGGVPSTDNIVTNNTIVEPSMRGVVMSKTATNNYIFNNLIVSGLGAGKYIVDEVGGNHIDNTSNLKRQDTTSLFIDYDNRNFHILETSPAVETTGLGSYEGKNASNKDYEGNTRPKILKYDIGADEYVDDTTKTDACLADINNDEQVELIDLAELALQFPPNPNDCVTIGANCMDFNNDGFVDAVDLAKFAFFFVGGQDAPVVPAVFTTATEMEMYCI